MGSFITNTDSIVVVMMFTYTLQAVNSSSSRRHSHTSSSHSGDNKRKGEEEVDPRVMSKVEAVRRDLHEQEMILRDSNLVMGHISPHDVMTSA